MYAKIRPRRSTTTEWNIINPILKEGELGIEFPDSGIGTGLCKFKIGDGVRTWTTLPYAFDAVAATAIYGGGVTVSHDICLRTGTRDEWIAEDPVLKIGEIAFDITEYGLKLGDGEHTFTQLDYIGSIDNFDFDFGDLDELE